MHGDSQTAKKLYYQELSMKISEFENLRQFSCIYVSPKLKEEEVVLHVDRNCNVSALLDECKAKVSDSNNSIFVC